MRTLNLNSRGLKIDFLSFNIQFTNLDQIHIIADYLRDNLHCKSTLLDQSSKKREVLTQTNKSSYSAEFVINCNKHWKGCILRFKGNHAQLFYKDLKFQKIDWSIFGIGTTNLGRIDLCYDRKLKLSDKDLTCFLKNSSRRINDKNDKRKAKSNTRILRVGKRSSSNFFRIYLKPNGKEIRFEIELKKTVAKNFQHYLFTNQFKRLEELLTLHFYSQAIKLFDIEDSYCDWLLTSFREVKTPVEQKVLICNFSVSYLNKKPIHNLTEIEFIYRLIQLLNYLKCLDGSFNLTSIGDQSYRTFKFSVSSFLEFIGKPKNNYYQVKKLITFLKSLQTIEPVLENFSDGGFRRYVAFPYVKVERKKCWLVELSICEKLCLYRYPFHLPETFLNYQDNFELKVKFTLLQSFCNISIRKEFPTQQFLEQVSISTSKQAKLKNYITKFLNELKDLKIIEPKFEILTKQNQFKEVSVLTSNLVSRSKLIFYTEKTSLMVF